MNNLEEFFPDLSKDQLEKFKNLQGIYKFWNSKVNVISRKDIDNIYINHILHSLSIAKVVQFKNSSRILDVGTGGGFPGIPLAIFFPNVNFTLIDSIRKKIDVVNSVCNELLISNVISVNDRVENHFEKYDFIISRAVVKMDKLYDLVKKNIETGFNNDIPNGILSLKGGDLNLELRNFNNYKIYNLREYFSYDFFETKKLVYITSK
ncbi:MAG: 16S rRNA (guanine(527)-N(7))-methyltransferase RsmG [Bacteroidota bacterium]